MKDKISQEIHMAIIQMNHEGMSQARIGKALGLHPSTVHYHIHEMRKTPYPTRKAEAIAILRAALARLEAA